MDIVSLLIALVLLVLPPAIVAFATLRIATRFRPANWLVSHPKTTYGLAFAAWLCLCFILLTTSLLLPTAAPPPASIPAPPPAAPAPSPTAPQLPPAASAPPPTAPSPPTGGPVPAPTPQGPTRPLAWWFPWPPPAASASLTIPLTRLLPDAGKRDLQRSYRLGDVDEALRDALTQAGHVEASYYGVPQGFALVTRIESILADGKPKPGDLRWNVDAPAGQVFSLSSYFSALFTAPPGRYRVVVFIVTPEPFSAVDSTVTRDQAARWLRLGANRLPPEYYYGLIPSGTTCTAMIYEFEKPNSTSSARLNRPGAISVTAHLTGTGLSGLAK